MARTRPWDETKPSGSLQVKQIDDEDRATKVDVREIFNQIIGVSEATLLADPVVDAPHQLGTIRTDITALQTNFTNLVRTITVPWWQFTRLGTIVGSPTFTDLKVTIPISAGTLWNATAWIQLPVGAIVTALSPFCNWNNAGQAISWGISRTIGPTQTSVHSNSGTDAGSLGVSGEAKLGTVFTHTVLTSAWYSVTFGMITNNVGSAMEFYSMDITYTSPNVGARA